MNSDAKRLVMLAVRLLKEYKHKPIDGHQGTALSTAIVFLERALAKEDTDWEELVGRFYHSLDGANSQNVNDFRDEVTDAQSGMFKAYRAVTGEK